MKKLLIVGVTSLVLFGVSASASYFWQQKQQSEHPPEKLEKIEQGQKETGKHGAALAPVSAPSHDDSAPRAAVRPAYNSGTEEIARMTSELPRGWPPCANARTSWTHARSRLS